jgi:predicted peroxiredoxin
MPLKLLLVVGSSGSRLEFVGGLAEAAIRSGSSVVVVFFGNSLYGIMRKVRGELGWLEGVSLFAHEASLRERGIRPDELVGQPKPIGDGELLELMVSSERTLCL